MANYKGQVLIDVYLIIFCVVILFFVFFAIVPKENTYSGDLLGKIIITENAISKSNLAGIGFAKYDEDLKTALQNTLQNPKATDPLKKIEIIDMNSQIIFSDGEINCKEQTNIERLVLYNDEIAKAIFYFCE